MIFMKTLRNIFSSLSRRLRGFFQRFLQVINRRPFASFIVFLLLLLGLVVVGEALRKPAPEPEEEVAPATKVNVFSQDGQPMLEFTAKVEKSGVITVVAQSPGIVRSINVTEGKTVGQGASLVSLSSTYQGGTAQSLSRQIAQRNLQFTEETYGIQKDIVSKQRELANKADIQGDELREINRKSLDDTRGLISLNEEIFNTLDSQIRQLEASNVNGSNDAAIFSAKQGKAAVAAGLLNLRSGLRQAEYQTADDKTPAQISDFSRDVALRQLDIQEKSLDLGKDIAELNLKLARISEQTMFPAAPCAGVVERVYVKPGDAVSPGMPIATIRANNTQANAVVAVPAEISRQINQLEPSVFMSNGKEIKLYPRYISTEATEGSLYGVFFTLPEELANAVTQGTSLTVKIPVGGKKTVSKDVIAPIDAIYQTADKAYIYVVETATQSAEAGQSGQTASLREVELGNITGEYVEVESGLQPTDQVITTRGITNGQRVTTN